MDRTGERRIGRDVTGRSPGSRRGKLDRATSPRGPRPPRPTGRARPARTTSSTQTCADAAYDDVDDDLDAGRSLGRAGAPTRPSARVAGAGVDPRLLRSAPSPRPASWWSRSRWPLRERRPTATVASRRGDRRRPDRRRRSAAPAATDGHGPVDARRHGRRARDDAPTATTPKRRPSRSAVAVATPRRSRVRRDVHRRRQRLLEPLPEVVGATVEAWLAANNATADTPLYVGDELCIPAGATAPGPPPTTQPRCVAAPAAPATTVPPRRRSRPRRRRRPPHRATTAAPVHGPARRHRRATADHAAPCVPAPAPDATRRGDHPRGLARRPRGASRSPSPGARASSTRAYNNWCCYGVFRSTSTWTGASCRTSGIDVRRAALDARTNIAAAYTLYSAPAGEPWVQTDRRLSRSSRAIAIRVRRGRARRLARRTDLRS